MAKRGFLAKHAIIRSAIKKDLLYFALPALLVFVAGLVVSVGAGWNGLPSTLWDLVRQPRSVSTLSAENIAGLFLILVGFAVCFVAVGTLRRFYLSILAIREDHQLITHGIYRFMRHPIYLGVIMVSMGVPVYVLSLFALLIMSALIPLLLNRIRMEERLLTDEFGDAYRKYKETTKKLIPFIY